MEHEMKDLCKLWKINSNNMSGFENFRNNLSDKPRLYRTGVLCIIPRYTVYSAAPITVTNKNINQFISYHSNPVYAVLDGINNETSVTVRTNDDATTDIISSFVYWHGRVIDVMPDGTIEDETYITEIVYDSLMLVSPISHIPVSMFKKFTEAFDVDFPWMI